MKTFSFLFFAVLLLIAKVSSATISSMEVVGRGEARYLGMIKVYQATLLADTPDPSLPMLHADVSRCLQLTYEVSLSASDFITAAERILERQHGREKLERVRAEIETLHRHYRDVKPGDRYSLCYQAAERKTTLSLNDVLLVSMTSAEFAEIYFGIWLDPTSPIDPSLQRRLVASTR